MVILHPFYYLFFLTYIHIFHLISLTKIRVRTPKWKHKFMAGHKQQHTPTKHFGEPFLSLRQMIFSLFAELSLFSINEYANKSNNSSGWNTNMNVQD